MGISRSVSEINGNFGRKLQIFPPRVFCAAAEGVPLQLGIGARVQKTRMIGLPVYLQPCGYNIPT